MTKKETAVQLILQQKLLPLYYQESAQISLRIMQALYEAGIRTIEYTNRGEKALSNFKELILAAEKDMPGMQLGIGTIKNETQAKQYIDVGASYIVCPSTNTEVAEVTHAAGLLWIPGCMTPTEIATAEEAGARLVKIFPGTVVGAAFIAAVKEIFPDLLFMPTGGVEGELENLRSWFKAGVSAVGMGSKLITKEIIAQQEYTTLTQKTKEILALIKNI